jgi:hypothetical protein
MTACGVIENAPVACHQGGVRDARRSKNDQAVGGIAMKCVR